ncbi:hypothetical protein [Glaciibacter flavus]|uniref:hypothetical protein n=1 Tax=Orlajensenia flava TaxID=2565934 RepID=UPI003AFF7AE5
MTALTTLEPDYRVAALEGVDRQRQRSVRHAVRSGEMGRVTTEDRAATIDYARAVAVSLPAAVSASVVGSIGALTLAASLLLRSENAVMTTLSIITLALASIVLALLPLQARMLRRAETLARFDDAGAASV